MTERFNYQPEPLEEPDWQRREAAVAHAKEAVGDGLQLGTVSVAYDSDYAAYGAVWIRAQCSEHEGELVSWASHPLQVRDLALTYVRQECPKYGHQQDYDGLARQSMPAGLELEGDI